VNLKFLQINLCNLIKNRDGIALQERDAYLDEIASSKHLLLVRKVSLWWRKLQISNYCLLSGCLLRSSGTFEREIESFLKERNYSPFREEVGMQFLEFLIEVNNENLIRTVASFELSLIKLKLGNAVESTTIWEFEPYSIIESLLHNTFSKQIMYKGNYQVTVSDRFKQQYFQVKNIGITS